MTTKKELAESLANVPLFERCTKRDLRAIARHTELVSVAAGVDVIVQGELGETFFLVLAGELAVVHDGRETGALRPGDHFGELALLDPALRSATINARSDVELAALSVRMFRVLLRDMPQISSALLGSLAGQLRETRELPPTGSNRRRTHPAGARALDAVARALSRSRRIFKTRRVDRHRLAAQSSSAQRTSWTM